MTKDEFARTFNEAARQVAKRESAPLWLVENKPAGLRFIAPKEAA